MICVHSFLPGGVERVGLRLAREWQRQGHDVRVVLGRREGASTGTESLTFLSRRSIVPTGRWETLWMMLSLAHFIPREQPDVIFCPGNSYAVVGVAMRLMFGRRCPPLVIKISNDLARADMPRAARFFYRIWLKVQGRSFERIVSPDDGIVEQIVRLTGAPAEQVETIPNPLLSYAEIERLAALGRGRETAGGRRYLAIGRLERQKNYPLMLHAFAAAAQPNDHLAILGDGAQRVALERLVHQLGISDRVIFAGHVAPESWLAKSDTLLLSSNYEGVPGAVVEAMAAGLAIVATDCSPAMRSLAEGGAATLVTVGDRKAFQDAMRVAAADTEAQSRIVALYVLERSAARFVDLFERL